MKLIGCEFHQHPKPTTLDEPRHPGTFLRIVQYGTTRFVRRGTRGTAGTLQTTHYDTPAAAHIDTNALIDQRTWDTQLSERCRASFTVPDDVDTSDPEALFLDHWRTAVFAPSIGEALVPPQWTLAVGAKLQRGLDPSADALLAAMESAPHAYDPHLDHVVGLLPRIPKLSPGAEKPPCDPRTTTARFLMVHTLAPVSGCDHTTTACVACSQRVAELLVFFLRGRHLLPMSTPERHQLVDTARRLARPRRALTPTH